MKVWKATSVSVSNGSRVVTVTTGDAIDSITINSWIQIGSSLPYEIKRGYIDGSTKKIELFEPWQGSNLSGQRAIAFPTRSEIEQLTQNVRDLIQSIETLENYSEFTRDSVVNLNNAASWRAALQVIGETDTLTTSTGLSGGGNLSANRTISVDASTGVLGEGSGEVRSNSELDSRYLKKDDISDASLVLDFVNNDYRVLENGILTRKSFSDILTFARNSSATMWSPSKLNEVGANIPRASSFDPVTGEPKGILVEESRTNLATRNKADANALSTWTKINVTVSTVVDSQFGNMIELTDDATLDQHYVLFSISATSTNHARSVFVKKPSANGARYLFIGAGTNTTSTVNTIIFDLDTGSFTQALDDPIYQSDITAESVGDGWRLSFYNTNTTSSVNRFIIGFSPVATGRGDTLQYSGTGSKLLIALPQIELGSTASSPIETESATVTRAADVVTVPDLSEWLDPDQVTIVVEFIYNGNSSASYAKVIELGTVAAGISLNTSSNGALRFRAASNGDNTLGAISPTITASDNPIKVAMKAENGIMKATINGESVITVGACTIDPSGELFLGSGSGCYLFRLIKVERIAVSDAELQALSTL